MYAKDLSKINLIIYCFFLHVDNTDLVEVHNMLRVRVCAAHRRWVFGHKIR